jgi:hypothetical protein
VTLCGTDGMVLLPEARPSFRGDSSPKIHARTIITLFTHIADRTDRVLKAMAIDQRPEASTKLPCVDWELYRRLKSEARLNLLFRF